jgi:hypothetical protein
VGWYRAQEFGFDARVCRGVHVGGCVAGRRWPRQSDWDIEAHAHNADHDPWFGWICVASERSLFTASRRPTRVMAHEYAHLLAPNSRHGAAWQEAVTELGYPSEAEWHRPVRRVRRPVRRRAA